jgi:hypothetical protein
MDLDPLTLPGDGGCEIQVGTIRLGGLKFALNSNSIIAVSQPDYPQLYDHQ